ncbi:MAG: hypothetical protein L3K26_06755, partial [Candidatus Hydrogenedentes bacterium]|nr:hypothetical protein [Candidatus Hydrogenedentota bacterium]
PKSRRKPKQAKSGGTSGKQRPRKSDREKGSGTRNKPGGAQENMNTLLADQLAALKDKFGSR